MGTKPEPPVIEARYTVTEVDGRPVRQPIFNNWRNAIPLFVIFGIWALWLLASRS